MSADRTLERTNPDWALYVSDFPSDEWTPDGWVAVWLHVRPTARLKVEQQGSEHQGPIVAVMLGPHCHLMLPRAIAEELWWALGPMFSAGVSEGDASPPPASSVDGSTGSTSTAPAEPSKERP